MKIYKANTFSEVYHDVLRDIYFEPEYQTQPRDLKINEYCDVALSINNPLSCLYSNAVRSSQYKYIAAEFLWYFSGRNDVDFIKEYAKFWLNIANPDGTCNSSYGNLLFNNLTPSGMTQYAWAYNSLVNDKDSRQAVIHFNLPTHQYDGNKDFVCTMYGIFQIRNNKLNFTISMRSNDAILGLPTDVAFFCTLQQQMLVHLKPTYPELELGEYTHIANSLHIYENNFKVVEEMLNEDFTPEEMPIVKESLINKNGSPAFALNNLLNNKSDASYSNSDEVYSWIHKKINKL